MQLKNIVYRIVFNERLKNKIKPYYYIGSKTNCYIKDNKIYNKNNRVYYGSSQYKDYKNIVSLNKDNITIDILYETTDKNISILEIEKKYQYDLNVVKNEEYFNLSYAVENAYNKEGYGLYRSIFDYNKKIKLPNDDPDVLNGNYVGITKGKKLSKEHKEKISNSVKGDKNPFYGKKHSEKTKLEHSKKIKCLYENGVYNKKEISKRMSELHKGKPKSEEHKNKIGRKGLIMLINPDTKETIRVEKVQKEYYNNKGWINLYAYKLKYTTVEDVECPYCKKQGKKNSSFLRWHFENCKHKGEKINDQKSKIC